MTVGIGIVIVVAGIAGIFLQRYHASVSADLDRRDVELSDEALRLYNWSCELTLRDLALSRHSARCGTAAECIRNLSTINALTVLYDRDRDDPIEGLASVDGAPSDSSPDGAVTPWIDSL